MKFFTLSIDLIVLVSFLMSASACSKKRPDGSTTGAPEVDVAEVVTDSVVLSKTYPGVLSAEQKADVVARVNGYLISQNYESGDHVNKGQLLFRIEDTQYRDAVSQAEASLANARSAYDYASKHYQAMQKALQSDAVAQIQVLEAKNALEQAEANIKDCQAALSTARTTLSYCTVRAPFSGSVSVGEFSDGAYVSGAGQPVTLATIYDNSKVKAYFSIEDASYMRSLTNENGRGMIDYDSVPVQFSEQLPHNYFGKLNYISPGVNTGTGTIQLRVELDNPYDELRDGMYCTVNMPIKVLPDAMLVKDASIGTSQSEKYLYVLNDSNRVVYTPITVGDMANDSMRIVTSGLTPGQKYVTRALLKVRAGMQVTPRLMK